MQYLDGFMLALTYPDSTLCSGTSLDQSIASYGAHSLCIRRNKNNTLHSMAGVDLPKPASSVVRVRRFAILRNTRRETLGCHPSHKVQGQHIQLLMSGYISLGFNALCAVAWLPGPALGVQHNPATAVIRDLSASD